MERSGRNPCRRNAGDLQPSRAWRSKIRHSRCATHRALSDPGICWFRLLVRAMLHRHRRAALMMRRGSLGRHAERHEQHRPEREDPDHLREHQPHIDACARASNVNAELPLMAGLQVPLEQPVIHRPGRKEARWNGKGDTAPEHPGRDGRRAHSAHLIIHDVHRDLHDAD